MIFGTTNFLFDMTTFQTRTIATENQLKQHVFKTIYYLRWPVNISSKHKSTSFCFLQKTKREFYLWTDGMVNLKKATSCFRESFTKLAFRGPCFLTYFMSLVSFYTSRKHQGVQKETISMNWVSKFKMKLPSISHVEITKLS